MITKIKNKHQLKYLLEQHNSDSAVARSLGITRQAVQGFRRKYNVPANKNTLLERNNEIRYLYKKDYTIKEIVKSFKLSRQHIYHIIRQGAKNEIKKSDNTSTGT